MSAFIATDASPLVTTEFLYTYTDQTWTSPAKGYGGLTCSSVGAGAGGLAANGGGGGGARSILQNFTYAPSTGYALVNGTGGANTGAAGGNATFNGTSCIAEGGGQSGVSYRDGGRASACTGTVKYNGGNGTAGAGGAAGGASAGAGGAASGATPGQPNGAPSASGYTIAARPGAGGRSQAGSAVAGADGGHQLTWQEYSTGVYADIVSWIEGRDSADGTSRSVTPPAGILPGDILLLIVMSDGTPTIGTSGASFTSVGSQAGTNITMAVFSRTATGSDSVSITTSASEQCNWYMIVFRRATVPTAGFATGTSANADSPNLSPGTGAWRYISVMGLRGQSAGITTTSPPSGYTKGARGPNFGTSSPSIDLVYKESTSTSENPGTWSNTNANWVAATIAVGRAA